ncbi:Conserved_hypothetical protein [Hexamita inflata]|uniref:Uncharacterized protein n=1 Tax=Hexamita inflata TaxID=28002 RepID=A0AA86QSL7_9EUKA|nr:Conserved hypothetical protein [Hexamita inflata]
MQTPYERQMVNLFKNLVINDEFSIGYNFQINSLKFVQHLNLKKLKLVHSQYVIPDLISDSLTELHLEYCQIQTICDLNAQQLKVLRLPKNMLKNINNIKRFKHLHELDLSENIKVNITPIKELEWLTSLKLTQVTLKNTKAIRNLTNLEELDISNNNGVNTKTIQYLTNLTKLNLAQTNVRKINNLKNLTNLIELNVSYNNIDNICVLQHLNKLRKLNISGNSNILHIYELRYLPDLQDLSFHSGNYIDLTPLKYLTKLTHLSLTTLNPNISVLRHLIGLSVLYLIGYQKIDITPLQYLTNLNTLVLQNSQIYEIYPLRRLTNLQRLDLQQTNITDISPLTNLQLKYLNIEANKITCFDPISKHHKTVNTTLENIYSHPNIIGYRTVFQFQPTVEDLILSKQMKQIDSSNQILRKLWGKRKIILNYPKMLQFKTQKILDKMINKNRNLSKQLIVAFERLNESQNQ